jgi:hypothetical protein
MTVQIFLQLLLSDFIQFDRINLLIFDECHHAVSRHPMRQVISTLLFLFCRPSKDEMLFIFRLTVQLLKIIIVLQIFNLCALDFLNNTKSSTCLNNYYIHFIGIWRKFHVTPDDGIIYQN